MPRLLAALLVASLLGNAALLLVLGRRPAPPPSLAPGRADESSTGTASSRHPPGSGSGAGDSIAPEIAAILNSQDPARLNALLLAAGVDSEIRLALVEQVFWKKHRAQLRELDPDRSQEVTDVWWRDPRIRYDSPEVRRRITTVGRLRKELSAELAQITGLNPETYDLETNSWLARQYGGLPPEKAAALFRIHRDYEELENELQNEAGSFELPEDREKQRLLRSERDRDIAALLTPEERAEWELRSSDTANRLRQRMTEFDVTEDEYRRIYALQKAFDTRFSGETDAGGREAAEAALEADIRAIVGEERYAAGLRENDNDFTTARAAAERLGLPAETPARLLALRGPAALESQRIAKDPSLNSDQKKAALAALAATTRRQVAELLGAVGAETYFRNGAMSWLENIGEGWAIIIKPNGDHEVVETEP